MPGSLGGECCDGSRLLHVHVQKNIQIHVQIHIHMHVYVHVHVHVHVYIYIYTCRFQMARRVATCWCRVRAPDSQQSCRRAWRIRASSSCRNRKQHMKPYSLNPKSQTLNLNPEPPSNNCVRRSSGFITGSDIAPTLQRGGGGPFDAIMSVLRQWPKSKRERERDL